MLRAALVVTAAVGAAVLSGVSAPAAPHDAPAVSTLDDGTVDRDDVLDRDDFTRTIDRDDFTRVIDRDDFDGGNGNGE
ncbi:hypothetical protein ACTMTJ_26995 [Phytohabitans sp. LJ34]|uniref:hypothetical protein n=1 Tax=Phytohabitans sp. LJ34 TaxID=3452217 RepID=UPI003F8B3547